MNHNTDYTKPVEIFVQDTKEIIPCKIVYQNGTYIVVEYQGDCIKEFIKFADLTSSAYLEHYNQWLLRNA